MSKELVEDPIERTPDEIMGEVMDKGFDSFYQLLLRQKLENFQHSLSIRSELQRDI